MRGIPKPGLRFLLATFLTIGFFTTGMTVSSVQAQSGQAQWVDQVKGALLTRKGVGDGKGVLDIGLSVLRATIIWFLMLYGIYIGIAFAFNQGAEAKKLVSFVLGTIVVLGAGPITWFFAQLFDR